MVQAGGFEPPQDCSPRIFIPLRLSPPPFGVCGLDYPFAVPQRYLCGLDAARLVSTPSPFGAWLGIAM